MTRTDLPNGVVNLVADDGMTLTDGQSFSKDLLVGLHGDTTAWYEITDAEAEQRQSEQDNLDEPTSDELLSIILGGEVK